MKTHFGSQSNSSHSVMGSSNIRVKVPDNQSAKRSSSISKATSSHRRTGSNKFSYASVRDGEKNSEEDDGSSSEEDFRSMRNKVKRN